MGRLGGVELVLAQCQLDRQSPLAREWALWAVRNLCEGNPEAQVGEGARAGDSARFFPRLRHRSTGNGCWVWSVGSGPDWVLLVLRLNPGRLQPWACCKCLLSLSPSSMYPPKFTLSSVTVGGMQEAIRQLQLCTTVESEELQRLGVKLELDEQTGKLRVTKRAPPGAGSAPGVPAGTSS